MTALCIASEEKGHAFLEELRAQGWSVVLMTPASMKEAARWPGGAVDQFIEMPEAYQRRNWPEMLSAISRQARSIWFNRVVALDDLDVEFAAHVREHLRVPGLNESGARFFRDKLAMRTRAVEAGIPVPEFVAAVNYDHLHEFME